MKLQELLRDISVLAIDGDPAVEITAVCADSRLDRKGALFAAIPGLQQNGAKFIDQAIAKGAVAVMTEPSGAPAPSPASLGDPTKNAAGGPSTAIGAGSGATQVFVDDARASLAIA